MKSKRFIYLHFLFLVQLVISAFHHENQSGTLLDQFASCFSERVSVDSSAPRILYTMPAKELINRSIEYASIPELSLDNLTIGDLHNLREIVHFDKHITINEVKYKINGLYERSYNFNHGCYENVECKTAIKNHCVMKFEEYVIILPDAKMWNKSEEPVFLYNSGYHSKIAHSFNANLESCHYLSPCRKKFCNCATSNVLDLLYSIQEAFTFNVCPCNKLEIKLKDDARDLPCEFITESCCKEAKESANMKPNHSSTEFISPSSASFSGTNKTKAVKSNHSSAASGFALTRPSGVNNRTVATESTHSTIVTNSHTTSPPEVMNTTTTESCLSSTASDFASTRPSGVTNTTKATQSNSSSSASDSYITSPPEVMNTTTTESSLSSTAFSFASTSSSGVTNTTGATESTNSSMLTSESIDTSFGSNLHSECGKSAMKEVTPGFGNLMAKDNTAKPGEFPWHAAIYDKSKQENDLICAATIITRRALITAAHCFHDENAVNMRNGSEFQVAVGKLYYMKNRTSNITQFHDIEKLIIPNSYRGVYPSIRNDVAILITKEEISFNEMVSNICLLDKQNERLPEGLLMDTAGWDVDEYGKAGLAKLTAARYPYIPHETCESFFMENLELYLTTEKFCTGKFRDPELERGDIGGGLATRLKDDRFYLMGIINIFSKYQPNLVFGTSIQPFYDWINEEIKKIV